MAFDKDAFLTALDSMSVMELNELVKAIEEKFGVSAAAMAAPAAGGAAGGAAWLEVPTHQTMRPTRLRHRWRCRVGCSPRGKRGCTARTLCSRAR